VHGVGSAIEQDPFGALRAFLRDGTVEELVVLQIDLEERRPLGNAAGD